MDALAALLEGPRARGAFLLRCSMEPPWSLRVQDEAPLTAVAVVRGHAWVLPSSGPPVRLDAGGVAVLRGPEPYVVADDPATAPQAVIGPGQRCTAPDGGPSTQLGPQGLRTWGNSPDGSTQLLTGTYGMPAEVGRRLLGALPPVVAVSAGEQDDPLVGHLAAEVARDLPGQEAVLDRLLDLVLIASLRTWLARPDGQAPDGRAPGWFRAHADPVVGPALRLMSSRPADPWTVASLARACGVSRALLARRFAGLVGEPPMTHLTDLRMALAADLLREPGVTVEAVARQVGYGSSFALSTAFSRVRGTTPTQHRRAAPA